jgi:hypothetical protein
MLVADLAVMYDVSTKGLNELLRRNRDRFPKDLAWQLTQEEFAVLKSQFATSSDGTGRPTRENDLRLRLLPVEPVTHLHPPAAVARRAQRS